MALGLKYVSLFTNRPSGRPIVQVRTEVQNLLYKNGPSGRKISVEVGWEGSSKLPFLLALITRMYDLEMSLFPSRCQRVGFA